MSLLTRLAAAALAVAALSACDPVAAERQATDATRYFSEQVLGEEYDVRLQPAAAVGPGALVVTRTRLTFEDGSYIPLQQVEAGVYRTPSLRSRYAAQGSRICDGRPVGYVTLHRGPSDLYYLNAGSWSVAPALPGQEAQAVPGACETTAYRLGAS